MARLMFASNNEREGNESGSSTSTMKANNKSVDVATMTSDECKMDAIKSSVCATTKRLSAAAAPRIARHGSSKPGEFAASRTSVVGQLTSKFDGDKKAVDSPPRPPLHPQTPLTNLHRQQRQLRNHQRTNVAEKGETAAAITTRNSSVQKTIELFEKDLANKAAVCDVIKADKKTNAETPLMNGSAEEGDTEIVEERGDGGGGHEVESGKPAIQPKPLTLQKIMTWERKSENAAGNEKHYHAPKIYPLKDRNLVLKDKRLSIAKDFSLESVLNNDMQVLLEMQQRQQEGKGKENENDVCKVEQKSTLEFENEKENENRVSTVKEKPGLESEIVSVPLTVAVKIANNSFLHKYLEQCVENNKTIESEADKSGREEEIEILPGFEKQQQDEQQQQQQEIEMVKNFKNSSELHDNLIKTLNGGAKIADLNGGYECLGEEEEEEEEDEGVDGGVEISDEQQPPYHDDHHYDYLKEDDDLYADVIYTQLSNVNDEIENYETVWSSENRGDSPTTLKNSVVSLSDENGNSDSESSLEQTNSLYDSKPTSDISSVSPSLFSLSNADCLHSKLNESRIYLNDVKSVSSGITDEEEDADYCDSDFNDRQEISIYRKRSKLLKSRKLRFFLHRKVSIGSCSIIYIDAKDNGAGERFLRNVGQQKKKDEKVEDECRRFLTSARSVAHPLPQYEAQEVTILLTDYAEECTQALTTHQPENVIDDFDDSSSSDFESYDVNETEQNTYDVNEREQNTTLRADKHSISRSLTQSQNIYEFVEKAKKTMRKSFSSLNPIRRISVSNIAIRNNDISNSRGKCVSVGEFDFKNGNSTTSGGSIRWPTFKSVKSKSKYSTINSSNSIFYLPPEDLIFNKNNNLENVSKKQPSANKARRRTTCIELARPTSPPPPPPVDRLKISEENSVSNLSIYSNPSTRSSNSGSELNSELNSSRSSDLHLRFADEPLYQFYAESIAQLSRTDTFSLTSDSDGYEEIASTTSRPSAMDLITPSPNGHGQHRSLWCEVPEVKNSGILDTLSPSKKKLQEAIFEIITSEASYYKSLCVLDKIFANSAALRDETVLNKHDWKVLFGNVTAVKKCSEKLLAALEKCWQDSILLTGLSDVIYSHASENFQVYIKYCSNQIYIDRKLKKLKERNLKFVEIISQLEANVACQSLNLSSFLMLPMQRITRLPLLVDAVLSKMDPILDGDEYKTYQLSLVTLNKIVRDCNEATRKLERYEEMLLLSQQLEFSKKDVKMYTIASSSRWLIRSGPMEHINPPDNKLTLTKKLTKQTTKLYFFLFNDIFIVAKKKNDVPTFVVLDYCARNVVQMSLLDRTNYMLLPTVSGSSYRYLLMLTILENHEGKTVEMVLNCDSDSTRQRWLKATLSHLMSDNPDEKLYEEWDCPQVSALHSYSAVQPDEMSLQVGDVVKVLKKTTDGWCHGERIRDGVTGWFPGNYTVEIASQHTRAKNLKLRHRLLTLSANYLQNQQKKN